VALKCAVASDLAKNGNARVAQNRGLAWLLL
jgi:hypothetical protein